MNTSKVGIEVDDVPLCRAKSRFSIIAIQTVPHFFAMLSWHILVCVLTRRSSIGSEWSTYPLGQTWYESHRSVAHFLFPACLATARSEVLGAVRRVMAVE